MNTREQIIQLADSLIRHKGYNAFSFNDISKAIGIKTASIHYHFPAKSDLGVAVIGQHIENLGTEISKSKSRSPVEKLERFLSIYSVIKEEKNVCIVGSLATDYNTLDVQVVNQLKTFSGLVLNWVTGFLEEGRSSGQFEFEELPRTKALLIISSMLAIVQLSRLTSDADFEIVKEAIKTGLLKPQR